MLKNIVTQKSFLTAKCNHQSQKRRHHRLRITVVSNILEKYHGCQFGEVFDRKTEFKNELINKNALYISREDYTYFIYLGGLCLDMVYTRYAYIPTS